MFEKVLFKRVPVWILAVMTMLVVPMVAVLMWFAAYSEREGVRFEIGRNLSSTIVDGTDLILKLIDRGIKGTMEPQRLSFEEKAGFVKMIENDRWGSSGYILSSGWDSVEGVPVLDLIKIPTGRSIYRWVTPFEIISELSSFKEGANLRTGYRSQHPLMLKDGGVVFTSGEGPLVKIDLCGNVTWLIDEHFHHSIEPYGAGTFVVAYTFPEPVQHEALNRRGVEVRNDGFAVVTEDGKVIKRYSVAEIMLDNDMGGLLFGAGAMEMDRLHVNDIQPVYVADQFFEKGDVFISVRNLSLVFAYRPSTNKVLWSSVGPWLNQHDPDYRNGKLTIFDNGVYRFRKSMVDFSGYASIVSFDFSTQTFDRPFDFAELGIRSRTGGVHHLVPQVGLIVESTEGQIYGISEQGKLDWRYTKLLDKGYVGALHWFRHYREDGINLKMYEEAECLAR